MSWRKPDDGQGEPRGGPTGGASAPSPQNTAEALHRGGEDAEPEGSGPLGQSPDALERRLPRPCAQGARGAGHRPRKAGSRRGRPLLPADAAGRGNAVGAGGHRPAHAQPISQFP